MNLFHPKHRHFHKHIYFSDCCCILKKLKTTPAPPPPKNTEQFLLQGNMMQQIQMDLYAIYTSGRQPFVWFMLQGSDMTQAYHCTENTYSNSWISLSKDGSVENLFYQILKKESFQTLCNFDWTWWIEIFSHLMIQCTAHFSILHHMKFTDMLIVHRVWYRFWNSWVHKGPISASRGTCFLF